MSFIYPRTVSIRRQNVQTTAGVQPYSGNLATNETVIAPGLAASIQEKRERSTPDAGLPSDAYARAGWSIFIPSSDRTLIRERDIVVDDIGKRYQVLAAYWNSLGYKVAADLLEA